ncbi:MAG TPA: hypothetical protein VNL16_17045, partial [Chloroflexota bacterium]|nr:hypothetical protein [Chloroflexota bacterium]
MLDTTRDGDPPLTATFKAIAPALVAFLLALAALVPAALTVPVHEDERQYVWTGAYYFGKLTHLDFRTTGSDSYTDPGWAPVDFWPLTQPMGTRFVFGTAMAVAGVPAPALPYSYGDAALQGPATEIPAETLPVVRLAAVLCAALGFALVAKRLGWRGTAAAALVLAMPFSREDLARAWAEGPLMLGLGLCTLAYGTRWFSPACGVAATFKLTALGLWPLALLKAANGGRYGALGIPIAAVVWSALTPSSWFLLGPVYLLPMLADRFVEYRSASQTYPGPFGIYFPTRYLVPF